MTYQPQHLRFLNVILPPLGWASEGVSIPRPGSWGHSSGPQGTLCLASGTPLPAHTSVHRVMQPSQDTSIFIMFVCTHLPRSPPDTHTQHSLQHTCVNSHIQYLLRIYYMQSVRLGIKDRKWSRKISIKERKWRRKWQATPESLPEKFYGQKSLVGCSP